MSKAVNPRVGVVLVNYNGHGDTLDCLVSLEQSGYGELDVAVVDNGSRRDSLEALLDHGEGKPGIKILSLPVNVGFAAGCNHGIRHLLKIGCDMVLVLNNDTVVRSGFLEKMVTAIGMGNNRGVVTGKIYYHGENTLWYAGTKWGLFRYRHAGMGEVDRGRYDRSRAVKGAPGCLMLITREVLKTVGLFDERFFFGWEDVYYCYRVRQAGYEIFYEPGAVIEHKVGRSYRGSPQKLYNGYLGAQLYLRSVYGYGVLGRTGLKAFALFALFVLYRGRVRGRIPGELFAEYRRAVLMACRKGQSPDFSHTTEWDCMHGLKGEKP